MSLCPYSKVVPTGHYCRFYQMKFQLPCNGKANFQIPILVQLTAVPSERGYNPETPSNFRNNPKATPLDDTPTEAGIGGACHLVKLLWLHPMTDTRKQ